MKITHRPINELKINLVIILSFFNLSLLLAEKWPFDPTNEESVRNYVPKKIFSIETTFYYLKSPGRSKIIEVFDDRCVYFYFYDYKQCFGMTEENYNKFVEFLENEKKWNAKYQDFCCRYSGFLQYETPDSILRTCSKLYSKHGETVNEFCGSQEELDYENRVFKALDDFVLSKAKSGLSMQGLLDDISRTYRKYVWQSGPCAACIPSYFHSPELREKEK